MTLNSGMEFQGNMEICVNQLLSLCLMFVLL